MRAKFIYEEFTQDSDPIHDLGIGIINVRNFKTTHEAAVFFLNGIEVFSNGLYSSKEQLKQIFIELGKGNFKASPIIKTVSVAGIEHTSYSPIRLCVDFFNGNFRKYGKKDPIFIEDQEIRFDKNPRKLMMLRDFLNELKYILGIWNGVNPPKINESFTQDSDPIIDLGIGLPAVYKNLKIGDILRVKKYISDWAPKIGYYVLIKKIERYPHEDWDTCVKVKMYRSKENLKHNQSYDYIESWRWKYEFFREYFTYIGNISTLF